MKKDEVNKKLNDLTDEIANNIFEFAEPDDEDPAKSIYSIYEEYMEAGFNSAQAFELTKIVLDNSLKIGELFE